MGVIEFFQSVALGEGLAESHAVWLPGGPWSSPTVEQRAVCGTFTTDRWWPLPNTSTPSCRACRAVLAGEVNVPDVIPPAFPRSAGPVAPTTSRVGHQASGAGVD
jgi:hypothetical protein